MNQLLALTVLILLLCLGPAAAAGLGKGEPPPLNLRIVDEMGEPISGVRIQAANAGEDGSRHQVVGLDLEEKEVVRTGETSADGVLRLSGFPLERTIWIVIEKAG